MSGSRDGRSTLDLFGRGFVLLRLGAESAIRQRGSSSAARAARRAADVIAIDEPEVLAAYERRLVLVRPGRPRRLARRRTSPPTPAR